MIDTAQAYGNERGMGEGVHTCGVPRKALFVASKVAAEWKTYEEATRSIDVTLEKNEPDRSGPNDYPFASALEGIPGGKAVF